MSSVEMSDLNDPETFWADQSVLWESKKEIQWESLEIRKARELDRIGRRIQVLVLVKTAPQLSRQYNDTVCVAGIALSPLRWVRLYPIPFRYLNDVNKFTKYSIIEVNVRSSENDKRFESLKVDASSIEVKSTLSSSNGWVERARYIEQVPEVCLCDLRENLSRDLNGPSLGLVRPCVDSVRMNITPMAKETPDQERRRREILLRQSLDLGLGGKTSESRLVELSKPPKFSAKISFRCQGSSSCHGHQLSYIDWEFTAAQFSNSWLDDAALAGFLARNFYENPTRSDKDLRFYVGNLANVTKRASYQILGLYYPSRDVSSKERSALFSFS